MGETVATVIHKTSFISTPPSIRRHCVETGTRRPKKQPHRFCSGAVERNAGNAARQIWTSASLLAFGLLLFLRGFLRGFLRLLLGILSLGHDESRFEVS